MVWKARDVIAETAIHGGDKPQGRSPGYDLAGIMRATSRGTSCTARMPPGTAAVEIKFFFNELEIRV